MSCLQFAEDLNVFDLETLEPWNRNSKLAAAEELRQALVLGIRDYCEKVGIKKIHLGSSGGIDSAVVAALAVDAMGPNNVTTFALPGPFSSGESASLAEKLAKNLRVGFQTVDIDSMYKAVLKNLEGPMDLKEFGLTHENIQARLRGLVLMAYSNKENSLLLTTSNKSEYASGYSTLYGDMCGGLAPLGDMTKAQVYELARYYNKEVEIIPAEIITRPPTAELRPGQKDQDTLPPYADLDKSVVNLVENVRA